MGFRSPGGARVRIGHAATPFDAAAADLEGFARLLWGLAPAHPEFWGTAKDHDQRLVEFAAIGLALRLVRDQIWHPSSADDKERALAYFLAARQKR